MFIQSEKSETSFAAIKPDLLLKQMGEELLGLLTDDPVGHFSGFAGVISIENVITTPAWAYWIVIFVIPLGIFLVCTGSKFYIQTTLWVMWSVTLKVILVTRADTPPADDHGERAEWDPEKEWIVELVIMFVITITLTDLTRIAIGAKPYLLLIVGGTSLVITFLPQLLCEYFYDWIMNHTVVCAAGIIQVSQHILVMAAKLFEMSFRIYINSGCSILIINDKSKLVNLRKIKTVNIQGVAGSRSIEWASELIIRATDNCGNT